MQYPGVGDEGGVELIGFELTAGATCAVIRYAGCYWGAALLDHEACVGEAANGSYNVHALSAELA